jgi:uncharacterized glyoxalase superfamily protein PhnB
MSTRPDLKHALPVLHAANVAETARYYERVLGFTIEFLHGDDPGLYARVARDGAAIHIDRDHTGATIEGNRSIGQVAYVFLENVDALADELRASGAAIVRDPTTEPYGMREMTVEDCNGYQIGFAERAFRPEHSSST